MFLRRAETARRMVATAWPVTLVNRSSGSAVRLASVVIVVDMAVSLSGVGETGHATLRGGALVGPVTGRAGACSSRLPAGRQVPGPRGAPGQAGTARWFPRSAVL